MGLGGGGGFHIQSTTPSVIRNCLQLMTKLGLESHNYPKSVPVRLSQEKSFYISLCVCRSTHVFVYVNVDVHLCMCTYVWGQSLTSCVLPWVVYFLFVSQDLSRGPGVHWLRQNDLSGSPRHLPVSAPPILGSQVWVTVPILTRVPGMELSPHVVCQVLYWAVPPAWES